MDRWIGVVVDLNTLVTVKLLVAQTTDPGRLIRWAPGGETVQAVCNRRRRWIAVAWVLGVAVVCFAGSLFGQGAEAHPIAVSGANSPTLGLQEDVLLFTNGDLLFGTFTGFQPDRGVSWSRPGMEGTAEFRVEALRELDFKELSEKAEVPPEFKVWLANGDQLHGSDLVCDAKSVRLQTSYAGELQFARSSVVFIEPPPPLAKVVFNGFKGLKGWTLGDVNVPGVQGGKWHYRDGACYATKAASLARDVHLPDVARIDMDLAWEGVLNLAIALYTDYMQPISLANKENEPKFGGFYSLQLRSFFAYLLPVKQHEPLDYLGQTAIPSLNQKDTAHLELRVNKHTSTIYLLVDGHLIQTWVDKKGFAGEGTGLRFVHQGQGAIRISRLKVTEWDGHFAHAPTRPKNVQGDYVKRRHSRAPSFSGRLLSIGAGHAVMRQGETTTRLPLAEVQYFALEPGTNSTVSTLARPVRGYLRGGGQVTFEWQRGDRKRMVASNPVWGTATFQTAAFGRLQFLFTGKP